MAKPTLLTVDDDPEVLRSVERDLKRHYGADFRVLRAESGPVALEILKKIKERNEAMALFLVDQRMPKMDGIAFLAQAAKIFPDAKRALLTAYADTDAAIAAINRVHVDQYLLKPWDPPEEHLYPILDDLIEDWQRITDLRFKGFVSWEIAGLLILILQKISLPDTTCHIAGSTLKQKIVTQKFEVWWMY